MNNVIGNILLLLCLLILSAFFSSSETVFSSANIVRLERYAKDKKKGAKKALMFVENFEYTISTILIGNNIVNILQAAIATKLFVDWLGAIGVFVSTLVMTIVILLFGEFLPKSIVKKNPEKYALKFIEPLSFLHVLLMPVSKVMLSISNLVSKLFKSETLEPSVTEEELISIVKAIEDEGVLEEKESELIRSAITFDDINIKEIYQDIDEIVMIEENELNSNIIKVLLHYHYSRIPIYSKYRENVIGILYEKDFLEVYISNKEFNIKSIIHKPIEIKGNMKISNLLDLFQKKKEHIAIVTNNKNEAAGIITLEDVLESLVGEIYDEHDRLNR